MVGGGCKTDFSVQLLATIKNWDFGFWDFGQADQYVHFYCLNAQLSPSLYCAGQTKRIIFNASLKSTNKNPVSMVGWMDGWMDGWLSLIHI